MILFVTLEISVEKTITISKILILVLPSKLIQEMYDNFFNRLALRFKNTVLRGNMYGNTMNRLRKKCISCKIFSFTIIPDTIDINGNTNSCLVWLLKPST